MEKTSYNSPCGVYLTWNRLLTEEEMAAVMRAPFQLFESERPPAIRGARRSLFGPLTWIQAGKGTLSDAYFCRVETRWPRAREPQLISWQEPPDSA